MHIQRYDPAASASQASAGKRSRPAGAKAEAQGKEFVGGQTDLSGELRELSGKLTAIPDVRADVVEASRMKLRQGVYLTRGAAEATAEAMLRGDTPA